MIIKDINVSQRESFPITQTLTSARRMRVLSDKNAKRQIRSKFHSKLIMSATRRKNFYCRFWKYLEYRKQLKRQLCQLQEALNLRGIRYVYLKHICWTKIVRGNFNVAYLYSSRKHWSEGGKILSDRASKFSQNFTEY